METKSNYPDEVVSAGQLLRILDTDAREVSSLCQKACLKPKKDGFGNVYFSKGDVDVLRKVKELYEQTKRIQEERRNMGAVSSEEIKPVKAPLSKKVQKIDSTRFDFEDAMKEIQTKRNEIAKIDKYPGLKPLTPSFNQNDLIKRLDNAENNIISRLTETLSEKLDGLDEVIVELIKAKTENESLRQKVNDLNKENFALKNENASYKPVGLGLYHKKPSDSFRF